jgi:hypothetical protein
LSAPQLALLETIAGAKRTAAAALLVELGADIAVSRDCPPTSGGVAVAVAGVGPALPGRRG